MTVLLGCKEVAFLSGRHVSIIWKALLVLLGICLSKCKSEKGSVDRKISDVPKTYTNVLFGGMFSACFIVKIFSYWKLMVEEAVTNYVLQNLQNWCCIVVKTKESGL